MCIQDSEKQVYMYCKCIQKATMAYILQYEAGPNDSMKYNHWNAVEAT